jgi:hypothetical protein
VLLAVAYEHREHRDDFYVRWDEFDYSVRTHHHHIRKHIAALVAAGWVEVIEEDSSGAYESGSAVAFRWLGDPSERAKRAPTLFEGVSERAVPRGKRAVPRDVPLYTSTSSPTTTTRGAPRETRATDDPVTRVAHRLAVVAFEQNPKPLCRGGFPAVLKIVEAALRSGRSDREIEQAIVAGVDVWTLAGLATSIANGKPRRNGRSSSKALDDALRREADGGPIDVASEVVP